MATKKQKIKVSIFLLMCIALMTVSTLVITGIYQDAGMRYWLQFDESILGLYEGGLVEYLGVPVGNVREIYVANGRRAHVDILIDPDKVTLYEGVAGQLVLYSIAAGTMAVSLSGGDPGNPPLPEYSQIPTKPSTIEAISSQLTHILHDMSSIADQVNAQISQLDQSTVKDIVHQAQGILNKGDAFLDDTGVLVAEATEAVKDIRRHADTLAGELTARSKDLERLAGKIEELADVVTVRAQELDVGALQQQVKVLLEEVTRITLQMEQTMAGMQLVAADIVHQTGNVEYSLRGTMNDLRDALGSVQALTNQLKDDPAALVRGRGRVRE